MLLIITRQYFNRVKFRYIVEVIKALQTLINVAHRNKKKSLDRWLVVRKVLYEVLDA